MTGSSIALNKELCRLTDRQRILCFVDERLEEMNFVNYVTALQRLAKCQHSMTSTKMMKQTGRSSLKTRREGSRCESAVIMSIIEKLMTCITASGEMVQSRHISSILWSSAKLAHSLKEPENLAGLCMLVVQTGEQMMESGVRYKGHELSISLWSLAKLVQQKVFSDQQKEFNEKKVGSRKRKRPGTTGPDHLAEADATDVKSFIRNLWTTFLFQCRTQSVFPQAFSNSCWAMVTLTETDLATVKDSSHQTLVQGFERLLEHSISKKVPRSLETRLKYQELSNVSWAFVKLKIIPSEHCYEMILQYLRTSPTPITSTQHLANIVWSMTYFEQQLGSGKHHFKGKALSLLQPQLEHLSSQLNAQEVSMISWSLTNQTESDASLEWTQRVLVRYGQVLVKAHTRHLLTAQQFSVFFHSVAKAGSSLSALKDLTSDVINIANALAHSMVIQDLDYTLWAFVKTVCSGTRPGLGRALPQLQRRFLDLLNRDLADNAGTSLTLSVKNYTNCTWALAKLKADLSATEVLVMLEYFLSTKADVYKARDLSLLAWAFSTIYEAFPGCPEPSLASKYRAAMKQVVRFSAATIDAFNAQECSKLMFALSKSGVGHEQLLRDVSKVQQQTFRLERRRVTSQQTKPFKVKISYKLGGGRVVGPSLHASQSDREKIGTTKSTGLALWEASTFLGEWLSSHLFYQKATTGGGKLPSLRTIREQGIALSKQDLVVELGAGVGLVSIIAYRCLKRRVSVIATDGDDETVHLLAENCRQNAKPSELVPEPMLQVKKLVWGETAVFLQELKHSYPTARIRLVLGSGIVYGGEKAKSIWLDLVSTIRTLCSKDTLVLLAHGQGAAPGVHESQGFFFDRLKGSFKVKRLEVDSSRNCVLHGLKLRKQKRPKTPAPIP